VVAFTAPPRSLEGNFVSPSADRERKKADSFHAFKHANDKFSTGEEQRSNSARSI
jgi:hypothetical protein